MTRMKVLLCSTALIGAGMVVGAPASVEAATIAPGGALDVTISGFARFRAHGGDLDKARLNNTVSTGLDFSNDTEVHVIVRGKDDATGVEYGGTVEFEADTNRNDNTDETWIFVRSGFGEFRFGDEDGPIDNSSVGGFSIGAGTGGIDGSVIDTIATGVVKPLNTGDSTKIRYYTPVMGGFQVGVAYTPNVGDNGDSVASKNVAVQQFAEGTVTYSGSFGGVDILASGVGGYCDNKNGDDDDCYSYGGGALLKLFGFKLAGGYFGQKTGAVEKKFYNLGVGASLGPVNLGLTYGQVVDSDNLTSSSGVAIEKPMNVVFSADVGLAPGLVLAGDVGYFDNDVENGSTWDEGDDGWQAVARLGLAF